MCVRVCAQRHVDVAQYPYRVFVLGVMLRCLGFLRFRLVCVCMCVLIDVNVYVCKYIHICSVCMYLYTYM